MEYENIDNDLLYDELYKFAEMNFADDTDLAVAIIDETNRLQKKYNVIFRANEFIFIYRTVLCRGIDYLLELRRSVRE